MIHINNKNKLFLLLTIKTDYFYFSSNLIFICWLSLHFLFDDKPLCGVHRWLCHAAMGTYRLQRQRKNRGDRDMSSADSGSFGQICIGIVVAAIAGHDAVFVTLGLIERVESQRVVLGQFLHVVQPVVVRAEQTNAMASQNLLLACSSTDQIEASNLLFAPQQTTLQTYYCFSMSMTESVSSSNPSLKA